MKKKSALIALVLLAMIFNLVTPSLSVFAAVEVSDAKASSAVAGDTKASNTVAGDVNADAVAGDVNADGSFGLPDVTLLLQYLAEWDVTIEEKRADVNGDGEISLKDVTLMLQYLAEWDVTMEVVTIYSIFDKISEDELKASVSQYSLVCADDADERVLDAVKLLGDSIEESTGVRLEVVRGDAEGRAIYFGLCGAESATAGARRLDRDEVNYAVYADSDGNIVLSGVDSDRVYYAAEDLAATCFGLAEFSNIHLLKSGKEYNATGHEKFSFCSSDSDFNVVQGAYFDGESYYVAIISKLSDGHEDARILELDADGNTVRESDVLKLDHANNVTYNPTSGMLIVTNCQAPEGHYDYLAMVDRETLTVNRYGKLDYPFFALAYSPELQKYASGQWAGGTLNVWNKNFDPLLVVDVETPGSLSQGCFCDAEGIYFVRSSQNGYPSEIRIYDWECNLVRSVPISLDGSVEPENINIVDGRVYVTGNDWSVTRGKAYTVTFTEQD